MPEIYESMEDKFSMINSTMENIKSFLNKSKNSEVMIYIFFNARVRTRSFTYSLYSTILYPYLIELVNDMATLMNQVKPDSYGLVARNTKDILTMRQTEVKDHGQNT